eukprot:scaffold405_cov132-Cylindrotheca_fusiformis.AAC.15
MSVDGVVLEGQVEATLIFLTWAIHHPLSPCPSSKTLEVSLGSLSATRSAQQAASGLQSFATA